MRLAQDVAEVRVGGECRRLVQDRLAHHRPHRLAYAVVAFLEVLADVGVRDMPKAIRAEPLMGEQGAEFDEREVIRREDEERVAHELFRARPEVVEAPPVLQDLREFGDPDEVRRLRLQRVQSHGDGGVGRFHEDEPVAQMTAFLPLAGVDRPQEERRRVAVEVEVQEAAVLRDVLRREMAQEEALAAPGLPEHGEVPRALGVREP